MASAELFGRARARKFRNSRAQEIMKLQHPALQLRQRAWPVAAGGQSALNAAAEPLVFVVHLRVDARTQVADRAHFTPLVRQTKYAAAHQALAGSGGQQLKEVHL